MKKKGKAKRKETEETKWKLGEETSKRKHVTDSSRSFANRYTIFPFSSRFARDSPPRNGARREEARRRNELDRDAFYSRS